MSKYLLVSSILAVSLAFADAPTSQPHVGDVIDGATVAPTLQLLNPAGESLTYHGRPSDVILSPDGKIAYVKDHRGLLIIDVASWKVVRQILYPDRDGSLPLPYPDGDGSSPHGIAITADGRHVYLTAADSNLWDVAIDAAGKVEHFRKIRLIPSGAKVGCYPAGVAISRDGTTAYVCLNYLNQIAVVDLAASNVVERIDVGIAPYDVLVAPDGKSVYVSNWGGRRAKKGEKTIPSAGTAVPVDEHGLPTSGTVSIVDLDAAQEVASVATGLHPAGMALTSDGKALYVACANSDSVDVIDTATRSRTASVNVRPDPSLAFGSITNAVALSGDGKTLYAANGGNNAVAVIDAASRRIRGYIPTAWFPGAVACTGDDIYVANVKGLGSRDPAKTGKWTSNNYWGVVSKVATPAQSDLDASTAQVLKDARVPQSLAAMEKSNSGAAPAPVPAHVGEPSVFKHVVYIIKENRTYDQVFGDIGKGNSDPKICIFGDKVTPNQHAIGRDFALLDNYYCNGVISADGHAWATQGVANDYLEKSFGNWVRSYPFAGDDPLAYAPTGFIWDDALLHGASFRNYGEFSRSNPVPMASRLEILKDFQSGAHTIRSESKMALEPLRAYSCPDYPGWNLRIPDIVRADIFLKEFRAAEAKNDWPNFVILYLPCDHTNGTSPGGSTPAAMVADNDLAVGQVVDAISHSKFWKDTCIFAIEDDPQAGFDHVDGHRSTCLVVSAYTKRHAIVSNFYNQTSILHTIELMLGLPPMNQLDAMAPAMKEVFMDKPDLAPWKSVPNQIPLDQVNSEKMALRGDALKFAELSERQPLDEPDEIDDDAMNRILWFAARGNEPYPAKFTGSHGTRVDED